MVLLILHWNYNKKERPANQWPLSVHPASTNFISFAFFFPQAEAVIEERTLIFWLKMSPLDSDLEVISSHGSIVSISGSEKTSSDNSAVTFGTEEDFSNSKDEEESRNYRLETMKCQRCSDQLKKKGFIELLLSTLNFFLILVSRRAPFFVFSYSLGARSVFLPFIFYLYTDRLSVDSHILFMLSDG